MDSNLLESLAASQLSGLITTEYNEVLATLVVKVLQRGTHYIKMSPQDYDIYCMLLDIKTAKHIRRLY